MPRWSTPTACTRSRPSSTPTCTCAPPAARTRRTSRPAPARRRPAASARSSPCRTPTRWWTPRRCCARCASAPAHEARIPTGFTAAVTVGQNGEQLTEMAELADAGAAGFTDDGLPIRAAGVMRQALQYQRLAGRTLALHEEDPSLSRRRRHARGRGLRAAGHGGHPVGVGVDDGGARHRAGRLRGRPHPRAARLGAARPSRSSSARRPPACRSPPRPRPHHLLLTDEDVRVARHPPQDEPAAARRGRPPGADRRACAPGRSTASPPTTRPHAREEKEEPFELAPMGVTGLETAFAALHTDLVVPGVLDLGLVVERLTAGGEPFGLPVPSPREGPRRRPVPGGPGVGVGGGGGRLREPLRQLRLRRTRG